MTSTFIDGIVLTQKHLSTEVRELAGIRSLAYREEGDISRDGNAVEDQEVIGEQFRHAWIQGSHATAIRVKSEGGLVSLAGNPGRWSRPDNLFNHDLAGTVEAANRIMATQNLPPFEYGEPIGDTALAWHLSESGAEILSTGGDLSRPVDYVTPRDDGTYRSAARVWSIHVTRNLVTGSHADALALIAWLDTQSIARVKKTRLGATTVVWGSLKYCQVEAYLKADEMMAHCKGEIEREQMRQNPAYQWARENGVVRIEVKAAKDYLRDRGLTYLGAWTMQNVIQLFEERTEILHRVKVDIEEFDAAHLPSKVACTAAAWLRGEDVTRLLSRATFFRHAAALRDYGIDITAKRNVLAMPVKIKTIEVQPAAMPDWYSLAATPLQLVRAA
jgi:hypothetical protein